MTNETIMSKCDSCVQFYCGNCASTNTHAFDIYKLSWEWPSFHTLTDTGFPPNLENLEFVIIFSRPGKCLEFVQKVVKTWNFNSKPWKNLKFANSVFKVSLFKMSFYKENSDLHLCHIYIININIVIWSQIDLGFHCFYLGNTWNFVSPEKWEPCYCK